MGFLDRGVWQQKMLDIKTDNGKLLTEFNCQRQADITQAYHGNSNIIDLH